MTMGSKFYVDSLAELWHGDCREILAHLPADSASTVITSPPYWGLRKYSGQQEIDWGDWRGALGLEPTPELYIAHLMEIMAALWRVLRKDGLCFINLSDSHAGGGNNQGNKSPISDKQGSNQGAIGQCAGIPTGNGLKPGDCCLIPERFVMACLEAGWYVHSKIVWALPNPMPESVRSSRWAQHHVPRCPKCQSYSSFRKRVCQVCGWAKRDRRARIEDHFQNHSGDEVESDSFMVDCPGCPKCLPNDGLYLYKGNGRPTRAYQMIYMLAKSDSYWSDMEAVREKYIEPMNRWGGETLKQDTTKTAEYKEMQHIGYSSALRVGHPMRPNESGRNLRDVWHFPTEGLGSFKIAGKKYNHFAAFPRELPKRCILIGCPPYTCPKCGKPWVRIIETLGSNYQKRKEQGVGGPYNLNPALLREATKLGSLGSETKTLGWKAQCKCGLPQDQCVPGTVLDPFVGSGTTLLAAQELGRRGIGIDLSKSYLKLCQYRLERTQPSLFPITEECIGERTQSFAQDEHGNYDKGQLNFSEH